MYSFAVVRPLFHAMWERQKSNYDVENNEYDNRIECESSGIEFKHQHVQSY